MKKAPVSRRTFLTGLSATVVSACTAQAQVLPSTDEGPVMIAGGPPALPMLAHPGSPIPATQDVRIRLDWPAVAGSSNYDVELNGVLVAVGLASPGIELGFGDRGLAPQGGVNRWRVRAANSSGERWSQPDTFHVESVGQIRARTFDFEDAGPLDTTVPGEGAELVVGAAYAFGGTGQGVSLVCNDPANTRAYKNHEQLPADECWVRLCIRPEAWSRSGVSVNLLRVRTFAGDTALNGIEQSENSVASTESVFWHTGSGLHSSSVPASVGLPSQEWSQVQLGIRTDGSIELWQFDGHREVLVGTGHNPGMVDQKSQVSFGNINPNLGMTFEIWLDEFAVGQQKLPWASPLSDRSLLRRPDALDPELLGAQFTFVFGSCNNASLLPYDTMALGAAACMDPDFLVHLGDHGYPDTGAYRQSQAAYTSLWSDLAHESNVAQLIKKPWLVLASDHDLGGNNISAETVVPFASAAFDGYNNNRADAEPHGRFGSLFLADGDIELIWLEEIVHRSPVKAPNDQFKTCLGADQKSWFLDRIASSPAHLVIVASQTTIGHISESGWVQYSTEREQLIQACRARTGWTRWLSGDKHTARWAYFEERLVEWGAAAWAEIPQGTPQPAPGVAVSASGPAGAFPTRKAALESLGLNGVAEATSFGHVAIDSDAGTANFSVRNNVGEVRIQRDGTILEETIEYRTRPWVGG